MLLSVVVPVYNAEKYLPECLNSLRAAWREGIEIVLVDDGSKDSSGDMCDCFREQHEFVKVVHQTNSGSVAARKKGVEEATGTYITAVDADDWIKQDYLEHMLCLIKAYRPDVIVTNFTSVCHQEKNIYKNPVAVGLYHSDGMKEIRSRMLCYHENPYQFGINPSLWAKCFKKEMLDRAFDQVPTDVSLGDDAMITYPCLYMAQSLYLSDQGGYNYRTNDNSMTHVYNAKLTAQCINLLKYFSKLGNEYKENFSRQVQAYVRYITKIVFMNEFIKGIQEYKNAKKSFMLFLKQEEVMNAMETKESFAMSVKDRLFFRSLSWKIIFLPYMVIRILYS